MVNRIVDNTSAKIEDAAMRGKVFSNAQIWPKSNGKTQKHKLNNTKLTGYTAQFIQCKSPSETFILRFSDKEKIN